MLLSQTRNDGIRLQLVMLNEIDHLLLADYRERCTADHSGWSSGRVKISIMERV